MLHRHKFVSLAENVLLFCADSACLNAGVNIHMLSTRESPMDLEKAVQGTSEPHLAHKNARRVNFVRVTHSSSVLRGRRLQCICHQEEVAESGHGNDNESQKDTNSYITEFVLEILHEPEPPETCLSFGIKPSIQDRSNHWRHKMRRANLSGGGVGLRPLDPLVCKTHFYWEGCCLPAPTFQFGGSKGPH